MKFQITFLVLVITFSLMAQSPDSVSMTIFVNDAIQANFKLKAFRSSSHAANARIAQSNTWQAPQVTVALMDNPFSGISPVSGKEREYSITQMIPFPGKNSSTESVAQARAAFAEDVYGSEERVIIAEVKKQYVKIYSAQRRLDVNSDNQLLLKQMIASVRSKYSVGQASQADILRMEIELSKLENQRSMLEQELRVSEAMMNSLRAFPPSTPIARMSEINLSHFSVQTDKLIERAILLRKELSAMKNDVAMNTAELTTMQYNRYPDVMIGGLYKERVGMPDTWAIMLGVSVPIAPWVSGKIGGAIEETEHKLQQSEARVSDMETMVRFEVTEYSAKAKSHWEQTERYRTSIIPNAQQTLESLLNAYQTGKMDFLSLIDSFRMLETYKMEYYTEVSNYLQYRYDLERAVGADFETNF